jgi:hypothetical protein
MMKNIFNGTPRDPARIPMILAEVQRMWLKHPDLRLGQLILNVATENRLYNMEDVPLIQELQHLYDRDTMVETPS